VPVCYSGGKIDNLNKSVNYYQGYHNTTRKNYHQKNVALMKKKVSGVRCQVSDIR
jgi:hypothetical protein